MKNIKRFGLLVLSLLAMGTAFAAAPSFDNNFAKYLTDATPDMYGRVETVFTLCVDRNLTLMDNVKNLFYPGIVASQCGSGWGQLWDVIKVLAFVLLIVFLVLVGVNFIMKAKDPDGPKKAISSLIYIAYGAFLIFGVIWILWSVLNIPNVQGTTQLVSNLQNNLFLQILSFFKVLGFSSPSWWWWCTASGSWRPWTKPIRSRLRPNECSMSRLPWYWSKWSITYSI